MKMGCVLLFAAREREQRRRVMFCCSLEMEKGYGVVF
jgi:hypothetical protein